MGQIRFYAEPEADLAIQRFGGSLNKVLYERKKEVKLALTGPSAGLEETNKTQPKTIYEKLADLKALLKGKESLGTSRPIDAHDSKEFIMERCRAVRVAVPANVAESHDSRPLSFWFSRGEGNLGHLCLLEGSGGDAENPYNFGRSSTYTLLQSLVFFARKQKRSALLDRIIPNDPNPNPYVTVDETHPPSLIEQYYNVNRNNLAYDFYSDPLGLLESWGCELSPVRDIEALYKLREYGADAATSWKIVTVFGYALCIQDGPFGI
jgi:hypothetical protein